MAFIHSIVEKVVEQVSPGQKDSVIAAASIPAQVPPPTKPAAPPKGAQPTGDHVGGKAPKNLIDTIKLSEAAALAVDSSADKEKTRPTLGERLKDPK
jgi:hypothetical protein